MSARRILTTALFTTFFCSPAEAYDCSQGGELVSTSASMSIFTDSTGSAVHLAASTRRSREDYENCPGWVRVEAWIHGDPAGAMVKQEPVIASFGGLYESGGPLMMIPNQTETYYGTSKHFWIYDGYLGDPWTSLGERSPSVTFTYTEPEPDPEPDPEEDCTIDASCPDDPGCGGFDCSPLIIDLHRNGFVLTSASEGVLFDINADGHLDRVAWTVAGSDDAWLAFDRNGNGQIDDGSELFGNRTPVYPGMTVTARNGFDALKFFEAPAYGRSEADGIINSNDEIYSRLVLWRDANHDGISQQDELHRLVDSGLIAVHTDYKVSRRRDQNGNEFRQRAFGTWADGISTYIYDVWLKMQ